ncbi:hypothetical protein ATG71_2039 [Bacillus sp. es.034]|nr:hypothetical protein ATG71_2039 [Bacillus sp. es.034]
MRTSLTLAVREVLLFYLQGLKLVRMYHLLSKQVKNDTSLIFLNSSLIMKISLIMKK